MTAAYHGTHIENAEIRHYEKVTTEITNYRSKMKIGDGSYRKTHHIQKGRDSESNEIILGIVLKKLPKRDK